MSIARMGARDWRTIYRAIDFEVEVTDRDDENRAYLETLRDAAAEELVEAIRRERKMRTEVPEPGPTIYGGEGYGE